MTSPRPGQLVFHGTEEGALVDHGVQEDGRIKLTMNLTAPGIVTLGAMRLIQRAVFKMGLEFIYVDNPDLAFDPKLDPVRDIVLGRVERSGWLLLRRKGVPRPEIEFQYHLDWKIDGVEILPVKLDIFGLVYESEMLARDPSQVGWA